MPPLPDRGPAHPISKDNVHSQLQSPLFTKIPAELRTRIFEYVIGSGTIHIIDRNCKETDNYYHTCSPRRRDSDEQVRLYRKHSHAVCQIPDNFSHVYQLSKQPPTVRDEEYDQRGCLRDGVRIIDSLCVHRHAPGLPTHRVIEPYVLTHWSRCFGRPQSQLQQGDYRNCCDNCCECTDPNRHVCGTIYDDRFWKTNLCDSCSTYSKEMTEKYGPAPEGLYKLHKASSLHLQLLKTCRLIYHETWRLPYANYTFDFERFTQLHYPLFTSKLLFPHQAQEIRSVHCPDLNYDLLSDSFPGLRILHMSCWGYPRISDFQPPLDEAGDRDPQSWRPYWELYWDNCTLETVQRVGQVEHSKQEVDQRLAQSPRIWLFEMFWTKPKDAEERRWRWKMMEDFVNGRGYFNDDWRAGFRPF